MKGHNSNVLKGKGPHARPVRLETHPIFKFQTVRVFFITPSRRLILKLGDEVDHRGLERIITVSPVPEFELVVYVLAWIDGFAAWVSENKLLRGGFDGIHKKDDDTYHNQN